MESGLSAVPPGHCFDASPGIAAGAVHIRRGDLSKPAKASKQHDISDGIDLQF
jgi:hypothetical protein